jgi:phosphate-selective porin OprO/OprP
LRSEVAETRQLKDQIIQLQNEISNQRSSGLAPANRDFSSVVGSPAPAVAGPELVGPAAPAPSPTRGETMTTHTIMDTGGSRDDTLTDFPLRFRYRNQSTAEGPIAGGTYLEISDPNEEFTLKFQNQVSIDSTNFDRFLMPTTEQGWNIPFGRTGIWGNVTRNFGYRVCLQYFLGDINLLDMFGTYQWDKFKIRFGNGLSFGSVPLQLRSAVHPHRRPHDPPRLRQVQTLQRVNQWLGPLRGPALHLGIHRRIFMGLG